MASEIKVDTIVNAGGDNDTGIDLSTNDQVKVKIANADDFIFKANSLEVQTSSNIDMNGTELILDADGDTSITADTDDQIDFKTGGTDRVVINSSGAVSIGTTSNPNNSPLLIACASDDNIRFKQETHASIQAVNDAANAFVALKIDGNELLLNSQSQNNVLIGTTSLPSASVGGAGFEPAGDNRSILNLGCTTTSTRNVAVFRNSNNGVGSIAVGGSGTAFNTSSDYRLKENVVTEWDATSRLKQLKPSRFNFKADKDTTVDGFLAHEVASIVPEAITGEKDAVDKDGNPEYQGIDQSKLVPLLVKTIQELEARIATLESK